MTEFGKDYRDRGECPRRGDVPLSTLSSTIDERLLISGKQGPRGALVAGQVDGAVILEDQDEGDGPPFGRKLKRSARKASLELIKFGLDRVFWPYRAESGACSKNQRRPRHDGGTQTQLVRDIRGGPPTLRHPHPLLGSCTSLAAAQPELEQRRD